MPSATDYPRLRAFLRAQKPPAPASLAELRGFLFGVACAPVLLLPSQWLNPCLAYRGEPEFDSFDEASQVTGELMALYNEVVEATRREKIRLPPDIVFRRRIMDNFQRDAPVSQWSFGFARCWNWLDDDWSVELDESDAENHTASFVTLTFFTSVKVAETTMKRSNATVEEMAPTIRREFTNAIATFAKLARIAEAKR